MACILDKRTQLHVIHDDVNRRVYTSGVSQHSSYGTVITDQQWNPLDQRLHSYFDYEKKKKKKRYKKLTKQHVYGYFRYFVVDCTRHAQLDRMYVFTVIAGTREPCAHQAEIEVSYSAKRFCPVTLMMSASYVSVSDQALFIERSDRWARFCTCTHQRVGVGGIYHVSRCPGTATAAALKVLADAGSLSSRYNSSSVLVHFNTLWICWYLIHQQLIERAANR